MISNDLSMRIDLSFLEHNHQILQPIFAFDDRVYQNNFAILKFAIVATRALFQS